MISDYQTLMRPVLECVSSGGARISGAVELLANKLGLTAEERGIILRSGKQPRFANRVNWAKSYLKLEAGAALSRSLVVGDSRLPTEYVPPWLIEPRPSTTHRWKHTIKGVR